MDTNAQTKKNSVDFIPREFCDLKELNRTSTKISNITAAMMKLKETYIEYFNQFNKADFIELISNENPENWIRLKYLKVQGINTIGFDVQQMLEKGLYSIPDCSKLSGLIIAFISSLDYNSLTSFITPNDFNEFFDNESRVVNPLFNEYGKITKRVNSFFTLRTETQEENEYFQIIDNLCKTFEVLVNKYKMSTQLIPLPLIKIEDQDGFKYLTPLPQALKAFRKKQIYTSSNAT
ncbi:MAG: hypothetical protein U0W24_07155 [Bacteroidales bacterium]